MEINLAAEQFLNDYFYEPFKQKIEGGKYLELILSPQCNLKCSYCYQINKSKKRMTKEIAKEIIDLIFELYYKNDSDFINKNTVGVVFEFIGGEPLVAIDIIDYSCSYFIQRCLEENHPWLYTWRISMISNGALYFSPEV